LRKNEPIGVKYKEGFFNKWVATVGVFKYIVLNFGILKRALFFPTRLDQCKIGPLDDILIKNAIIKISKNKMAIIVKDINKSKALFISIDKLLEFTCKCQLF
jgi:hypothetical protein